MAGLLEKLNSYPKTNRVFLEGEGDDTIEEQIEQESVPEEPKSQPETKSEPDNKPEPVETSTEDKEPPRNAPKAEKEAYRERKLKAADAEKKAEKDRADRLEKQLEAIQKEKDDWKKQAEIVASNRYAPAKEEKPVAKANNQLPDIATDPVGHLSQRLNQSEQRYQSLEAERTNERAFRELESLESAYSKKNPEHDAVMKHAEDESVKRNMLLNPNANESQLRSNFKTSKLETVVKLMSQGMSEADAVEKVHNMSKVIFGYQPKPAADPVADKEAAAKAKFAAVQKNKAKSGTGLGAGGSAPDADLIGNAKTNSKSLREIAKMSKSEKDAYYRDM